MLLLIMTTTPGYPGVCVCVGISISRNISVDQVPTFQASPESKAGGRGDRETEGKQESCQSCQKEEDSGVNEIYGG